MFEVKIPVLTDSTLMAKYKKIKPLVRREGSNSLSWIKGYDNVVALRNLSYPLNPTFVRDVMDDELYHIKDYDFTCLLTWGSIKFFKPSIAEVLSQINSERVSETKLNLDLDNIVMNLVAFEVIEPPLEKDHLTKTLCQMGYCASRVKLYYSYKNWRGFPEGV